MNLLIVWDWTNVLAAFLPGVIVGGFLARVPRAIGTRREPRTIPPARSGWVAFLIAFWFSSAFWAGQVFTSVHDPNLDRIVSRYLLSVVFCVAVGMGVFAVLLRESRKVTVPPKGGSE